MKVCPFNVIFIYTILQQVSVQFCLDLKINVLLIIAWFIDVVILVYTYLSMKLAQRVVGKTYNGFINMSKEITIKYIIYWSVRSYIRKGWM